MTQHPHQFRPPWTVTLSSKGQMTVPAALARNLQLKPGQRLAVAVEDADTIRVTPIHHPPR